MAQNRRKVEGRKPSESLPASPIPLSLPPCLGGSLAVSFPSSPPPSPPGPSGGPATRGDGERWRAAGGGGRSHPLLLLSVLPFSSPLSISPKTLANAIESLSAAGYVSMALTLNLTSQKLLPPPPPEPPSSPARTLPSPTPASPRSLSSTSTLPPSASAPKPSAPFPTAPRSPPSPPDTSQRDDGDDYDAKIPTLAPGHIARLLRGLRERSGHIAERQRRRFRGLTER